MEHYGVEAELEKLYQRRLWLKSGGFLTIDQTEALVAIDVNTGRSAKEEDPEQLIFSTNMEAAAEIARQIRLRDLSGLVLIDFIDMEEQKNTEKVVTELRKHLVNDRSKADFRNISRFGLLEMTRERTRPGTAVHALRDLPDLQRTGPGEVAARNRAEDRAVHDQQDAVAARAAGEDCRGAERRRIPEHRVFGPARRTGKDS